MIMHVRGLVQCLTHSKLSVDGPCCFEWQLVFPAMHQLGRKRPGLRWLGRRAECSEPELVWQHVECTERDTHTKYYPQRNHRAEKWMKVWACVWESPEDGSGFEHEKLIFTSLPWCEWLPCWDLLYFLKTDNLRPRKGKQLVQGHTTV